MSAADGAPVAVGPMASMSWYSRPAEGQGVIGRLGCIGETCFKKIRFRNGCSGRGDLRPAREGESLQVQHEKRRIIQCNDVLPISAGDAERSGWKEGYNLLEVALYERCSSTSPSVGDANGYFFEEEEVKADTPRGFRRDGFLHSETQGRDRGNKEDTLQLEHCTSMSSVSGGEVRSQRRRI